MSDEERQCYICLDGNGDEAEWVSPCRCAGSIKWVHRRCLIRWVREHEATHPWVPVSCPQCTTRLRLVPKKGAIVSFLQFIDTAVYPVIKCFAGWCFTTLAFDTACTTFGIFAQSQVYGLEETLDAVSEMDERETIVQLKFPAILLVFINSIPWERSLLEFLRRLSRLPIGIGWLLPEEVPARFRIPDKFSLSQTLFSSALLPFIARMVGNVCFSFVDSVESRVIFGGLTFLATNGVCWMYLTHKLEMRRKTMFISPYRPIIRQTVPE